MRTITVRMSGLIEQINQLEQLGAKVLCVYMAMIQENMVIWSMATWKTTKLCQALSRLARVEVCNLIMKTFYQDQTTRLPEL